MPMNDKFEAQSTALLLIDFVNDVVTEGGKLAGKGYSEYIQANKTHDRIQDLLEAGRRAKWSIIHVRVGFSDNYVDHPAGSPLFGAAKKYGALSLGAWGTEFAEFALPSKGELVVTKHRVSAFFGTDLDIALRSLGIRSLLIAGCATDLAVQSAVRDAHDRDFSVYVVEDACAAANAIDHNNSIPVLQKISKICTTTELIGG